ncbi:type II toxin-antitoxin system RelE/ParE family toxin [Candidatus Saganbacteria bacterium]|nr:type II toxin-antitoxin system RelE/ParE family toxin [Candidatus Saganbacteria bacterium]
MSAYQILITPRTKKDLKKIDHFEVKRIDAAIMKLESIPFPDGVKRLIADDVAQFRIRIGDYRVLYDVEQKSKTIIILRIGHRKDIYR